MKKAQIFFIICILLLSIISLSFSVKAVDGYNVSISPEVIYPGETTYVSITVTDSTTGLPVQDVKIGIDEGLNLSQSVLSKIPTPVYTGSDGVVSFGLNSEATGNATIFVDGVSDPSNPHLIRSSIRKTMYIDRPASVIEGEDFEVNLKDVYGNLITDATIYVTFNGETKSTTTGKITLTTPDVSQALEYTIEATVEGYTSSTKDITVINKPKLYIAVEGATINDVGEFVLSAGVVVIKAGGDDGNEFGITVTLTNDGGIEQTGVAPLTVDLSSSPGKYIITAIKSGYITAVETLKVVSDVDFEVLYPNTEIKEKEEFTIQVTSKGEPVEDANVYIQGKTGSEVKTDSDGNAILTAPENIGSFVVVIEGYNSDGEFFTDTLEMSVGSSSSVGADGKYSSDSNGGIGLEIFLILAVIIVFNILIVTVFILNKRKKTK